MTLKGGNKGGEVGMTKQEILDRFSDIDFVYNDSSKYETLSRMLDELLKEQEAVVHCGDCENFCFDSISPNAGRCMLTNMCHSKTWFCAHGKKQEDT